MTALPGSGKQQLNRNMVKKEQDTEEQKFALGRDNYRLLLIGFIVIIAGFILMVGGRSEDPTVFNDAIFSFRRITLAPVVVLFGFLFEVYAIMKK